MRTYHLLQSTSFLVVFFLLSCSTTKHIPDDDQLFVGLTKIDYQQYVPGTHFDETQEEIEAALATAPNGAFFGSSYYCTPFPYRLWIWNYSYGSSGKFKQWLNHSFGKAPVLMSQVNPALRASVAESVLRKNGYLHGSVSFSEVAQKNPKKMKIGYTVRLDTLFTIDTLAYVNFPAPIQHLIDSTRKETVIDSGVPFSVATLDGERSRISSLLRNNGYYYYLPGYASYLADTLQQPYHAQLRLQLADSLPEEALKKWYIGRMNVGLRRSTREAYTDSLKRRFLTVLYNGKRPVIRPRVILSDMKLRPRQAFSYNNYTESVQKINSTGVFSSTDFVFTPREGTDTLDLTLNCVLDKPYDFYVETNFINRTIGRYGPELKVGFTKRNAFRGAEKLDINLHGSYEWQKGGEGSTMNSYQYGADAAVEFPRIIFPKFGKKKENLARQRPAPGDTLNQNRRPFVRREPFYSTPWTIAKISTDIVQRPSYYKMHIVSGEWTYRWQPSATSRHEFSPLTLKYQFFNNRTTKFEELLARNSYLSTSMDDYFIPKMRYTYTYSSQTGSPNPIRWETTLEESGNVSSLYFVAKGRSWNEKRKTMFKNPYSQFVKVESSLTKTWQLNAGSQLVGHLNAGYLINFGNSSMTPFSESFYVGGANSIRAFTVRSIGPGAMPGLGDGNNSREFSYVLRNGNIKFQANLEYRRRLFGSLYGALFLDMGNVWKNDYKEYMVNTNELEAEDEYDLFVIQTVAEWWNQNIAESRFRLNKVFNQLASGTGLGLRYDLDFLVIRVDWGFGLHLPYDTGKSGYFNISRFRDMHSLHFAVGYPF